MLKKTFIFEKKLTSTNTFLLEMPEVERVGKVVCAEEQTSGKGMGTNTWESAPGLNLTFSMGVDMSFLKAADQFLLSQAVPLGLLDALNLESLMVKWPNDLVYEGRKLCGILINSTIQGAMMGVSVVGIGLNVNQMEFQDWPTHPISLKMILGEEMKLEPLLCRLVEAVDRRVQQLQRDEGVAKIKNDYLNHLFRYQQWGDYETKEGRVRRYITGLDQFGRLETLDEEGKKAVYDIKELMFV